MARTFTAASRNYAAGTYGPFAIDGFVSADTDFLDIEFTVENWPTASPLITGELRWNTGDGMDFAIASPPRDRLGNLLTKTWVRVSVPEGPDGKAIVSSATAMLTAHAAMRTSVTLRAINATDAAAITTSTTSSPRKV
jgi:hypothetical protein